MQSVSWVSVQLSCTVDSAAQRTNSTVRWLKCRMHGRMYPVFDSRYTRNANRHAGYMAVYAIIQNFCFHTSDLFATSTISLITLSSWDLVQLHSSVSLDWYLLLLVHGTVAV